MLVSLYKAAELASSFFSTSLHILSAKCRQHPVPASCPHQLLSQLAPTTYVCSLCSHTTRDWHIRSLHCKDVGVAAAGGFYYICEFCVHMPWHVWQSCWTSFRKWLSSSTMGSIWGLNSGCHAYSVRTFSYWSILLDTCWLLGVF